MRLGAWRRQRGSRLPGCCRTLGISEKMDYFDFFRFRKDVLYQSLDYRLIRVRIKFRSYTETILVREWCDHEGKWNEQIRVRFDPNEIIRIKELL